MYIDTSEYLYRQGFSTTDGVHYDENTSKKIKDGVLGLIEDPNMQYNNSKKSKFTKVVIGNRFVEIYKKHLKIQGQLDNVDSWLFKMLEKSDSTIDYISIIKYLLFLAAGKDYGVSEKEIMDLINLFNNIQSFSFKQNRNGKGFWWPIGSLQTETIDGKVFATGETSLDKTHISRAGKAGSKYHGYGGTHEKGSGAAVDIAGNLETNKHNVISIGNGTVISVGDGIADGNRSGNRTGLETM